MTTAIAKTKTKSNSKPKSKPPKPFSLKALVGPPKQDWTIAKLSQYCREQYELVIDVKRKLAVHVYRLAAR
jgi:hypothetical protein